MIVRYKLLSLAAKAPAYMSAWAAGLDLYACGERVVVLRAGDRVLVPCGVALEIPFGYEGQIRPRSSLAVKYGVTVANAPGTIDSDYRGEISVCLANLGQQALPVYPGDRIAQLVIAPVERVQMERAEELGDTTRGTGGFGSTGTR